MEKHFTRWLRIGYDHARWLGVCPPASEDCATEFMEHMLQAGLKQKEGTIKIANAPAWEHTCARRFALNYQRGERTHEQTCDSQELTDLPEGGMTLVCSHRPEEPLDSALRRDFHRQLLGHLNALPVLQREVFVRHHLKDKSVQDIADALNKTVGAIEQTLWRTRHRLRQSLLEQNDADAACLSASYLPPPA